MAGVDPGDKIGGYPLLPGPSIGDGTEFVANDSTDKRTKHLFFSTLRNAITDAVIAIQVAYNNATSGLSAVNVQEAIDELDARTISHSALSGRNDPGQHEATAVSYDNTVSSIPATDVQEAVDYNDSQIDAHTSAISALILATATASLQTEMNAPFNITTTPIRIDFTITIPTTDSDILDADDTLNEFLIYRDGRYNFVSSVDLRNSSTSDITVTIVFYQDLDSVITVLATKEILVRKKDGSSPRYVKEFLLNYLDIVGSTEFIPAKIYTEVSADLLGVDVYTGVSQLSKFSSQADFEVEISVAEVTSSAVIEVLPGNEEIIYYDQLIDESGDVSIDLPTGVITILTAGKYSFVLSTTARRVDAANNSVTVILVSEISTDGGSTWVYSDFLSQANSVSRAGVFTFQLNRVSLSRPIGDKFRFKIFNSINLSATSQTVTVTGVSDTLPGGGLTTPSAFLAVYRVGS